MLSEILHLPPEPAPPRILAVWIVGEDGIQMRVVEEQIAGIRLDERRDVRIREGLPQGADQRGCKNDIPDPVRADNEYSLR